MATIVQLNYNRKKNVEHFLLLDKHNMNKLKSNQNSDAMFGAYDLSPLIKQAERQDSQIAGLHELPYKGPNVGWTIKNALDEMVVHEAAVMSWSSSFADRSSHGFQAWLSNALLNAKQSTDIVDFSSGHPGPSLWQTIDVEFRPKIGIKDIFWKKFKTRHCEIVKVWEPLY